MTRLSIETRTSMPNSSEADEYIKQNICFNIGRQNKEEEKEIKVMDGLNYFNI